MEAPKKGGAGMDDLYNLISEFERLAGPSSDPPPFPTLMDYKPVVSTLRGNPTTISTTEEDGDYSSGSSLPAPAPGGLQEAAGAFDMLTLDFDDVSIEKRKNRIEQEILAFQGSRPQHAVFSDQVQGVNVSFKSLFIAF